MEANEHQSCNYYRAEISVTDLFFFLNANATTMFTGFDEWLTSMKVCLSKTNTVD